MLMQGFPPIPDALVTIANWQDPPYNRWSFWHVRELMPTQDVCRGAGPARVLQQSGLALDVPSVPVTRIDGSVGTVGDVLDETYTDAWLVLHHGELVAQWHGPLGAPDRPHLLMSVSKSVVGAVAAVLIDRGDLDAEAEVTTYVPELAQSGFAGATVRHLLDMRSGVRFREEYTNPDAQVRQLDDWISWRPGQDDQNVRGLYGFLATLEADTVHGGPFNYRSSETDALGWVCERAGRMRMADLVSTLVWGPMGAEHDAAFMCDGLGTAVHDGGLCATTFDLACFGQMLLDGGVVPDGSGGTRTVLPPGWLSQAWNVDIDVRAAFAASPAEQSFPGGWYRNQLWFRPGKSGDVLLCLGIHGQMVHVNRRTRTVCVKFSTWPDPQSPAFMHDTLRAFDAVGGALAVESAKGRRSPPGSAAGVQRRG